MNRFASLLLLLALGGVIGCAVTTRDPASSLDHPANAQAPVLPLPPADNVLAIHAAQTQKAAPEMPGEHAGHSGHTETAPATSRPAAQIFTCPHHPEVRSTQPGTCPKCGMQLVPTSPAPQTHPSSMPGAPGGHEHHGGSH